MISPRSARCNGALITEENWKLRTFRVLKHIFGLRFQDVRHVGIRVCRLGGFSGWFLGTLVACWFVSV